MKHPDYDRAFPKTPDYIRSAIELGIRKGKKRAEARRRLAGALTIAAALVVILGAAAFGASRLAAPKPDRRAPVVPLYGPSGTGAGGFATATPIPGATRRAAESEPEHTVTPAPTAATEDQAVLLPTPTAARASTPAPTQESLFTPEPMPQEDLNEAVVFAESGVVARERVYEGGALTLFHLDATCEGGAPLGEISVRAALEEGLAPCPSCVPEADCLIAAFPPGGSASDAVELFWYTEGGARFHVFSDCGGMENASARFASEAVRIGKLPCPVCLNGWDFALVFSIASVQYALPAEADVQVRNVRISADLPVRYIIPISTPTAEANGGSAVSFVSALPESAAEEIVPEAEEIDSETEEIVSEVGEIISEEESAPEESVAVRVDAAHSLAVSDEVYVWEKDEFFHLGECERVLALGANIEEDYSRVSAGEALRQGLSLCYACEKEAYGAGGMRVPANMRAFFYTPNGLWYHVESDCSGMRNATIHTLGEAVASGKPHCPVCIGDDTFLYWLDAPESDDDPVYCSLGFEPCGPGYFHVNPECFGARFSEILLAGDAAELGLAPCPACLPEAAREVEAVDCYADAVNGYYHADAACPKLEQRPERMTELEAQAAGKLRCPTCGMDSAAVPEGWTQYRAELGACLADVFHGWIFERADVFEDRVEWFASNGGCALRAAVLRLDDRGSVRELTLGADDPAESNGNLIDPGFLSALPAPLSAIWEMVDVDGVIGLHIDYDSEGEIAGFAVCRQIDGTCSYPGWRMTPEGAAYVGESKFE